MTKEQQKQHLIDMIKQDEELGLYDEQLRKQFSANVEGSKEFNEMCKEEQTKCYCGHTITCDCGPEQETNLDKHLNSLTEYPGPRRSAIISKQEILLEDIFNDEKRENIKKFIDEISNPSQPNDKLKQAFEKYSEYLEDFENKDTYEHGFKDGAKCQQEISYSEEEVLEIIRQYALEEHLITSSKPDIWFEQFKNK